MNCQIINRFLSCVLVNLTHLAHFLLSYAPLTMQNDKGEFVDLYLPRSCDVSNQTIGAKDHASISLRFVEVDKKTGRMNGKYKTFNISGAIRTMGECDDSLNRLAVKEGILPK